MRGQNDLGAFLLRNLAKIINTFFDSSRGDAGFRFFDHGQLRRVGLVNNSEYSKKIQRTVGWFVCPINLAVFVLDTDALKGFVTVYFS